MKAATGEEVTAEELGGADVHARISGVADHYAMDEDEALARARDIVGTLTSRKETPWEVEEPEDPLYDPEESWAASSPPACDAPTTCAR